MFSSFIHVSMKIPNLLDIAMAWARAARPTPEQALRAEHRLSMCNVCEFKAWSTLTSTFLCSACGCPLSKKVYATGRDACPKGIWTE